jgi:hypothetical protein
MTRPMRWPAFAVILPATLLLPGIAQAQHKCSALISTSHAMGWTGAGLPDAEMAPNHWMPPTRKYNLHAQFCCYRRNSDASLM